MPEAAFAAVDLGASSGRVMVGRVDPDTLVLRQVHRFPNRPVRVLGRLHWNVLDLYAGVLDGLRAAGRDAGALTSVGIDGWAIDYGLLDQAGRLLGNPLHYRDTRTEGVLNAVLTTVPAQEIYACTGTQFLPFNTLYQLAAEPPTRQAHSLLLLPDLLSYWLTGVAGTELTNASTTQLLDVRSRSWATGWPARLGVDTGLFAPLRAPGDQAGELLDEVLIETGLTGPVPVVAVGSHDTASAVVGVPAAGANFAYISCGTWSLVGVELDRPVLTAAGRAAGFSNELGVDGTVRYLRNVMGLWLLQECLRQWGRDGLTELETLLHQAARVEAFSAVVDVDAAVFLPPGDMPGRIAQACRDAGQRPPHSPADTVRCILDSLALAYRAAVRDAQRLSGRHIEVVHLVGGGSLNALLCQLTADACHLPVIAGPMEAAALGNILVQARAAGTLTGDVRALRGLLRKTQPLERYEPHGTDQEWAAAQRRLE